MGEDSYTMSDKTYSRGGSLSTTVCQKEHRLAVTFTGMDCLDAGPEKTDRYEPSNTRQPLSF